jgi:uncharacterized membrane protein (DUF485 family)
MDDPWYEALAVGERQQEAAADPAAGCEGRTSADAPATAADARTSVYLDVQHSAAFQEVRGRYRGFVFPAAAGFLLWYLFYVVLAMTAPGLMARPVAGEINVAMLAGLAQFASTFVLTFAYARHARLRRDRAALDLRWDTQERIR